MNNFKDGERRKNDWSLQMEIPEDEQLFKDRPTVVGIHGWKGFTNFRRNENAMGKGFQMVSDMYKRHKNVNYVSAKWVNGFSYGYNASVLALEAIGHGIVNWLDINLGYDKDIWRNLTIVGFSLGGMCIILLV